MQDETELRPLAGSVYAFPGDSHLSRPWIGVVVTSEGTVLIDSGNGPLHAAAIKQEVARLPAPPVTHILLTHHHWDHVFGNASYPDVQIIAHELTQSHLLTMAEEPWSRSYVEQKAARYPRGRIVADFMKMAVPAWDQFRVAPATESFRDRREVRLGQHHFTIEHVGGQHEPDQCIIHVKPENVLFLGDAAYGRGPKQAWDRPTLAETLTGFLKRGADWYVEGHRSPVGPKDFKRRISYLTV